MSTILNEDRGSSRLRLICVLIAICLPAFATSLSAETKRDHVVTALPVWLNEAGARSVPNGDKNFSANSFGANGDGAMNSTRAIQQAIDACANSGGGTVTFNPGNYLTGALFVKSNVNLNIPEGVTLSASQDDADYPSIWTRVAGIEMKWPAAMINVNGQKDVRLFGGGIIDGRGEKWWERYRAMREDYDARGIRWAADYDAQRVRLMVIWESSDVTIENLTLKRSGFWTVQTVYSDHVTIDGLKIRENEGPSTDGVDIDSSRYVLVENSDIDGNDDDICLKAGRDADGLRVNRPTEFIIIRNNIGRNGTGLLSFGSETSGGIRNVVAYHNQGVGSLEGIRFKSARTRGGVVEGVLIRDFTMKDVAIPFTFTLNWKPNYSYPAIPTESQNVPDYWRVLSAPVPKEQGLCQFRNITIKNVVVVGAGRMFSVEGLPEKPIENVNWINVHARASEAGLIENARDWKMKNVWLRTADKQPVTLTDCENVAVPHRSSKKSWWKL